MQALARLNLRRAAQASPSGGGSGGSAVGGAGDSRAGCAGAPPRPVLLVGYAMKPSREAALAGQGLLQLVPRRLRGGPAVAFVPLDLGRPLGEQPPIGVLLHKGSDELVAGAAGRGGAPAWSDALLRLQRELAQRPDVAVVDPFECTAKVRRRGSSRRVLRVAGMREAWTGGVAIGYCANAPAPAHSLALGSGSGPCARAVQA
jgi:hypothetical protein